MTRTTVLAVLLLATVAASLYGYRLADSPVYLTPDEVVIGLDAHTLATTSRDLRGHRLPLYFQIDEFRVAGKIWYQPAIMYLTAAILQVAPLSAAAIRTPSVMVGVVDVVLMFLLARRLFADSITGVLASSLLLFSSAHFMHSRFAMDYVYPLPFILGWLYALTTYLDTRRPGALCAAGACLGLGFYSYITAMALMPMFAALTLFVLWRRQAIAHWSLLAAGFAVPLTLFVGWVLLHPTVFSDTVARYGLGSSNRIGLVDRFGLYWRYLSPSFLFFNGGSQLVFSSRVAGVFPVAALVLLPAGVISALRRTDPMRHLLVLGLLISALPAILLDEGSAINRAMGIVPFGVLLSAAGFDAWRRDRAVHGAVAAALVLVAALQFSAFARDYFGDYRVRSASWFQYNVRGGLDAIIERTDGAVRPVYLNDAIRWVDSYWRFQLRVAGRPDLLPATHGFTRIDRAVPAGSLLLINATDPSMLSDARAAAASGDFALVRDILEPDGTVSFVVLERTSG